ncbi:L domain-like protein [Xylaria sp. CBS 124048]|nr:L domain-like protein [Xylaria sp. CBS 124048]
MDEKGTSIGTTPGRTTRSGPKPSSRLPLPRSSIPTLVPTSTTRLQKKPSVPSLENPRASVPQLSAAGSRRLRAAASHEQINSSATLPRSYRPGAPSAASQSAASKDPNGRNANSRSLQSQPIATDSPFKKPAIPRRQPSGRFNYGRQASSNLLGDLNLGDTTTIDDTPELPPLVQSPADDLASDASVANSRNPTPSLSERTIETLSKLPSSPMRKQRASQFFDMPSPMRSPSKESVPSQLGSRPASVLESRPGSSHLSDGTNSHGSRPASRPGSSSAPDFLADKGSSNVRAPTNSYKLPLATTPSKRLSTYGSATPMAKGTAKLGSRMSMSNLSSRNYLSASVVPSTPVNPDRNPTPSTSKFSSKTMTVRPTKTRGSVKGLFNKSSKSSLTDQPASDSSNAVERKESLVSSKSSRTSGGSRNQSSPSATSTAATAYSVEEPPPSARKSSAALRDQIAKAKAAKRATSRQAGDATASNPSVTVIPAEGAYDFELSEDPFGQKSFEESNRKVMQSRIDTARVSGRLNIAAMGLKEIPEEVLKMYDLEAVNRTDASWAESVDLTRLIAADNELETIDNSIFPDISPEDFDPDKSEDAAPIFWGLESADLHNNMLISLPMGLRRLQVLNALNLTSNKLTNSCLEIIAQCSNLRDLKLGNNLLHGPLEDLFLENLEILDLHGNGISVLPDSMDRMKKLRILNLDENALESLPFQSLAALPLSELHVRKNKLQGTLIEGTVEGLPQLQILNCSNNQLSYLTPPDSKQPLNLPSLHQLTVSMNRLKSLPDMSSWNSILTINAEDNAISAFPDGFTSRETLKHAGFSGNAIHTLPSEIARMDNLAMLKITGNPLREKRFTSLTTEEVKNTLLARLEPLPTEIGGVENFANGIDSLGVDNAPVAQVVPSTGLLAVHTEEDEGLSDNDHFATPPTSAPQSPARSRSESSASQTWPVKPGGILDRSNTQSSSLHPVVCSKVAATQTVREVRLEHNSFTHFPDSLSFFSETITSLSMSHNQLSGESWLTERLNLTALRELNLQSNYCTSLTPLTTYLCAPKLEKLDVSLNRITRLPTLRDTFPGLTVLLISNNRLEDLDPDSIRGLKIVDASNNEIAHLNPRLGLLGLDKLDVMGNRFRVPRWNVLERGTEATLRWLRGRVSVAEMGEWHAKSGVTATENYEPTDVD